MENKYTAVIKESNGSEITVSAADPLSLSAIIRTIRCENDSKIETSLKKMIEDIHCLRQKVTHLETNMIYTHLYPQNSCVQPNEPVLYGNDIYTNVGDGFPYLVTNTNKIESSEEKTSPAPTPDYSDKSSPVYKDNWPKVPKNE